MYPLIEQSLTILDVSKHWHRNISEKPPWTEVFDTLLQGVWTDELLVSYENGAPIKPRDLLILLNRVDFHPGIIVYQRLDDPPITEHDLPDGGVSVVVAQLVFLPSDPAMWSDSIVKESCALISKCALGDFSDLLRPRLTSLVVTRTAFEAFCIGRQYPLPSFWFGLSSTKAIQPRSFGGRPSTMRLLEAELYRRAALGILDPSLRREAMALRSWAETQIPIDTQIPTTRSIENGLRKAYREALKLSSQNTKHKT